jgi:PAS domain S-box-containing protein
VNKRLFARPTEVLVRPAASVGADRRDDLPVALVGCDLGGRITSWNRAATALLGWAAMDAIGRAVIDIFGRDVFAGVSVGAGRIEVRAVTAVGMALDVDLLVDGGSVFAVVASAATRPTAAGGSPRVDSWTDASTAVRSLGGSVQCVSVSLLGVEGVNSGYSRSTGDAVLREVMARLAVVAGDRGRVLRTGGNHFVMVVPASACASLSRVISEIAAPVVTRLGTVRIAGAVGAAVGDAVSALVLLDRADAAMRRAVERGAGAIESAADAVAVVGRPRSQVAHPRLQSLLIEAVADRQIRVQYQPVVHLQTGQIVEFEALARWTSSELGDVDAGTFIESAESSGLIHELGRHVVEDALDVVVAERNAGRWAERRMSINISAVQLAHPELIDRVVGSLAARSLPGAVLQFDLTETRFMPTDGPAADHLDRLRAQGIRVAVDNFGTGSANVSYLRDLPIDAIKIDRRFIAGMATGRADRAIVRSLVALAHDLRIQVIGVGVETDEQHWALLDMGCTIAQGHRYSAARTADALCLPIDLPCRLCQLERRASISSACECTSNARYTPAK